MSDPRFIPQSEWRWFGCAGHFICAQWCRFHLTTQIGRVIVSTVGEYLPPEGVREVLAESRGVVLQGKGDMREFDYLQKIGFEDIGYARKYETMVFKSANTPCELKDCKCGYPGIVPTELDMIGYMTAGEAARGHYALCHKWANENKQQEIK